MSTTPQDALAFQRRVAETSDPTNVFKLKAGTADGAVSNFPAKLGARDPEDAKWQLVRDADAAKAIPGQYVVGDDYFNYIDRKNAMEKFADFRRYVLDNVDLTTPEKQQFWYNQFPWIKDIKVDEINRNADLQKRLAKINFLGPQEEDDWFLLYQVQKGNVKVPTKPVHQMNDEADRYAEDFHSGFFSIYRWLYPTDSASRINYGDPMKTSAIDKPTPRLYGTGELITEPNVARDTFIGKLRTGK
jgi:hypothetical protein